MYVGLMRDNMLGERPVNSSLEQNESIIKGIDRLVDRHASEAAKVTYKKYKPFTFGELPEHFKDKKRMVHKWAEEQTG